MKRKIKEGGWTIVWRRKTRKRKKKKKRNEMCMDENEMKGRKII